MKSNSLAGCILFALSLQATQEEVAEVIDSIQKQFGIISNAGTVNPAELVTGTSGNESPAGIASVIEASAAGATLPATDKNGLPWDDRIHSSSKAINADGSWRYKKGVDEATKKKVEASLRATVAAPVAVAAEPVTTLPALPTMPGLPSLPGANVIDPTYAELVKLVADNTPARINNEWLEGTAIPHFTQLPAGTKLQDIAHRPDLALSLLNGLKGLLGG